MSDFESTEEIYKYLLEGNTLISGANKSLVKLINGFLHTKSVDGNWYKDTWSFCNLEMWSKYKEPEWFDNIPKEGILCWVYDLNNKNTYIPTIIASRNLDKTFTATNGNVWYDVKPLTKEELKVLYDNSK